MTEIEDFLTGPSLAQDGVAAIYTAPDNTETPLTVLFNKFYVGLSPLGENVDADEVWAMGSISALSVTAKGGFLTINGVRWLITKRPQSDGRVWTRLVLGEP